MKHRFRGVQLNASFYAFFSLRLSFPLCVSALNLLVFVVAQRLLCEDIGKLEQAQVERLVLADNFFIG